MLLRPLQPTLHISCSSSPPSLLPPLFMGGLTMETLRPLSGAISRITQPSSAAALAAIGAATLAALRWLMSPLLAAARSRRSCDPSEDYFPTPGDSQARSSFPNLKQPPSKNVSIIVPAYNEEERLPKMLDLTFGYLDSLKVKDKTFTYEVVVVDDGSTDQTAEVVMGYVKRLGTDMIRLCKLCGNQGKGAAVRKGMLRMRGEYGLMADADAATDITGFGRLFEELKGAQSGGFGVGIGSRSHLAGDSVVSRPLLRTITMWCFHLCVSVLCTRQIKDTQCGFKLFTRSSAALLFETLHLERWAFDVELIYLCDKLALPMVEVPVNWEEVPGSKLIQGKLDVITASISMLRDMLCVRVCYLLGLWRVDEAQWATREWSKVKRA